MICLTLVDPPEAADVRWPDETSFVDVMGKPMEDLIGTEQDHSPTT
jgi:hypothetical protein